MDAIQLLTKKGASCTELLSCLYNLTSIESQVFYELASSESATLDDVAAAVKRDRSTTHRALQKLVSAGLCYKESKSLKDGGYYHVYTAVEPSRIKEQAELRVREVTRSLERLVENFESDFRKHLKSRVD